MSILFKPPVSNWQTRSYWKIHLRVIAVFRNMLISSWFKLVDQLGTAKNSWSYKFREFMLVFGAQMIKLDFPAGACFCLQTLGLAMWTSDIIPFQPK